MKINLKMLLHFFIIIIALSLYITWKMPLSSKITKDDDIYITFFTPTPLLVEIKITQKTVIIKEINLNIPQGKSKISYVSELLKTVGVKDDSNNIFYFEMANNNFEEMIRALKKWRITPIILLKYFSIVLRSKSNLHPFDKINLALKLISTNQDNILYIKMAFSTQTEQNYTPSKLPTAALLLHPSKMKFSNSIINLLRLTGIDILEYKKLDLKDKNTHIIIKSEKNVEDAKKIIKAVNQKFDIPIILNPKIIYDIKIYIGRDFMEGRWN